jgi:hypothetical protein
MLAAGMAVASILWGHEVSTREAIAKLSLGVLLTGLAGYAAGQSAQHRRREAEARRLELDLIAFPSFIRELPEVNRVNARDALVSRIFGAHAHEEVGSEPPVALDQSSISLLAQLADALLKVRGRTS